MSGVPGIAFDRRLVSRALTRAAQASVADILAAADPTADRRARVIGVTGAPGAGKSTLIGRLAALRLEHAAPLAVIAIDPTSPCSHGSLLGDRIRMAALSEDPRVFIRSLPSRSSEDGLTDNLAEIVAALDPFGFAELIVETVGAGQTAYGVRAVADVEVLVLTPGGGDYVQAMKAGIMETADVYIVNKADLPGAERFATELLGVLGRGRAAPAPPVVLARADDDAGIRTLSAAIDAALARTGGARPAEHRHAWRRHRVRKLIQRALSETLETLPAATWDRPLPEVYREVAARLLASGGAPGRGGAEVNGSDKP